MIKLGFKISKERIFEINKYGRAKIYSEILKFLPKEKSEVFLLVNHLPAFIDDKLDNGGRIELLNTSKVFLKKGFENKSYKLKSSLEQGLFSLGNKLAKLNSKNSKKIFKEILNYWDIERVNFNRKNKILKLKDLDKLNLEIGKSVGLQFLYLLCENLPQKSANSMARAYGFAIKLADNLSDLKGDLNEGFINISREDIKKYRLNLSNLKNKSFLHYKIKETNRIKRAYFEADKILDKVSKKYPTQKKGIYFFKKISHTWFKQSLEKKLK